MTITISSLVPALRKLPDDATEAVVNNLFINPLLEILGFEFNEVIPEFSTGQGVVDIAARKNKEGDIFLTSNANPYLLVEVKARNFNLVPSAAGYQSTVNQLKKYLLAPKCQSVQWGIITNSSHIQIFRKHGKTIFPASKCLAINETNVDEVIASIRRKIAKPHKALTVAIYNNQGGVGKTTTTVNIAGILSFLGKKVLVVDFDHNQQDLTTILGIPPSQGTVFKAMTDREIALQAVTCNYTYLLPKSGKQVGFDVIPADTSMTEAMAESNLLAYFQPNTLHRKLEALRYIYDYILIDAPPNWKLFSKLPI